MFSGCFSKVTIGFIPTGDPRTRLPDPFFLSALDDSEGTHALLAGESRVF